MRKQTLEQITSAVQTLENVYKIWPNDEATTIENAIDYCYKEFNQASTTTADFNKAVRFDGKGAIKAEIRRQIMSSEWIKIKEARNTQKQMALEGMQRIVDDEYKKVKMMKDYGLNYCEGYDPTEYTNFIADLEKFIEDHK